MAAEKLTKKRLIQLLVMLVILIAAFTYRSCHYQAQTALEAEQQSNSEESQ